MPSFNWLSCIQAPHHEASRLPACPSAILTLMFCSSLWRGWNERHVFPAKLTLRSCFCTSDNDEHGYALRLKHSPMVRTGKGTLSVGIRQGGSRQSVDVGRAGMRTGSLSACAVNTCIFLWFFHHIVPSAVLCLPI